MAKTVLYRIKRNGKYLQTVDANERYCSSGRAPTMGAKHSWSEYKTIWGDDPRAIEPLSAISYLRTLLEEYRWEEKKPIKIEIIPYWEG